MRSWTEFYSQREEGRQTEAAEVQASAKALCESAQTWFPECSHHKLLLIRCRQICSGQRYRSVCRVPKRRSGRAKQRRTTADIVASLPFPSKLIRRRRRHHRTRSREGDKRLSLAAPASTRRLLLYGRRLGRRSAAPPRRRRRRRGLYGPPSLSHSRDVHRPASVRPSVRRHATLQNKPLTHSLTHSLSRRQCCCGTREMRV